MKFVITLVLLASFSLPQISHASTESEYRERLIEMVAELQALILQLKASLASGDMTVQTPTGEFSSLILSDDAEVISHYRLNSPAAVSNIKDEEEREFFARFYYVVPDEFDRRFKELLLFDERRETMDAFVETIPPYTSHDWRFGINEDIFEYEADDVEVTALFLHEFAHVLGYDGGIDDAITEAGNCHEYFVWGCPPTDSYVDDFIDSYWDDNTLDEFEMYGEDLWTEHELNGMFVSSYAATSPEEDFAESFSDFVLKPKPNGTVEKAEKVLFFYQYSELVKMRESIRARL